MLRRSTSSAYGTASPGRYTKRCATISSSVRGVARNSSSRASRAAMTGRPRVAVVGAEAREVDVAEIEDVLGLDVEEAVAARVAGGVDDAHPAAAELEDVAVTERRRVRPRRVVELLEHGAAKHDVDRRRHAVDRHHRVDRPESGQVGLVEMPRHVGEEVVPGDVVLVAVAVQYAVDARERRRVGSVAGRRRRACGGAADQRQRRIDDDRLLGPGDEERIPVRVLAVAVAAEDGDPAERAVHAVSAGGAAWADGRDRCGRDARGGADRRAPATRDRSLCKTGGSPRTSGTSRAAAAR